MSSQSYICKPQKPIIMSTTFSAAESFRASVGYIAVPFPWKLHELLTDAANDNTESIVSWLPQNNGFKIHDKEAFEKTVMPKYFPNAKFKSFQRQ